MSSARMSVQLLDLRWSDMGIVNKVEWVAWAARLRGSPVLKQELHYVVKNRLLSNGAKAAMTVEVYRGGFGKFSISHVML
jgi:hypothetical protein